MQPAAQLALLLLLLTWHVRAQSAPLARPKGRSATTKASAAKSIPIFTFHGPVISGTEAEPAEIVLHVLLKAKIRDDGAFAVRTVSYAERFEVQGKQTTNFDEYFVLT